MTTGLKPHHLEVHVTKVMRMIRREAKARPYVIDQNDYHRQRMFWLQKQRGRNFELS